MADQLSLALDPELPRLPASLLPMLPQPADAPFDSVDHLFEPNWGGRRVLAFVEAGGRRRAGHVRIVAEPDVDVAAFVPEIRALAARLTAQTAVLDGELVVVDRTGRADHEALRARLRGEPGAVAAYLVSDLLYLDGRPLLGEALERRRQLLRTAIDWNDQIVLVPAIAAEGRALFDAVVEQGLAGVMARERQSPYLPGVRSGLWRFIERGATAADEVPGTETADQPVLALIRRLPLEELW